MVYPSDTRDNKMPTEEASSIKKFMHDDCFRILLTFRSGFNLFITGCTYTQYHGSVLLSHLLPPCCSRSAFNLIRSSIRKIEMAASVAKRKDLIFEMAGSTTPATKLSDYFINKGHIYMHSYIQMYIHTSNGAIDKV